MIHTHLVYQMPIDISSSQLNFALYSTVPQHVGLQAFDITKLTPEQKQLLALRIELVRRRRAEMAAALTSNPRKSAADADAEDLDGANTYGGFGLAAALPFLGLYGLGLGGLGVGNTKIMIY